MAKASSTPVPVAGTPARPDASRDAAGRSGVRARAVEYAILVVEPDAAARAQLVEEARSVGLQLVAVATPDEAASARTRERPQLIACHFPMEGAVRFAEALHRERFPVLIATADVLRAIATFGFDLPIVQKPLALTELLDQAHALVASGSIAPAAAPPIRAVRRAITERPPPPNDRDRRRD